MISSTRERIDSAGMGQRRFRLFARESTPFFPHRIEKLLFSHETRRMETIGTLIAGMTCIRGCGSGCDRIHGGLNGGRPPHGLKSPKKQSCDDGLDVCGELMSESTANKQHHTYKRGRV